MKKFIFFVIISSLINIRVISQEITWGKIAESETMFYTPQIFGIDDHYMYSISLEKTDPIIEKFDKHSFEKVYSKIIDRPVIDGKKAEFERIDLITDKFVVFCSIYDEKEKESKIYGTFYDLNTGEKSMDNILILSVPVENRRRGYFEVFISKNNKFVLINHIAYYRKQKEYKAEFKLLDEQLNLIVEKQEITTKDSLDFETYNWLIDNEGSVYYTKSYYNGENYIVSYDANKNYEKWERKIDLSELKTNASYSNITFSISPENILIVCGYYKLEEETLEGCFYMKIENVSKELVIERVNIFEKSFKNEFLSTKDIQKNRESQIPNLFNILNLYHKNDGGVIIIGEKFSHYILELNYMYTHNFEFGDLIVLNLSPDGEMIWAKRIPKNQARAYVGNFQSGQRIQKKIEFFSYLAGIDSENLYLFYNENPKNLSNTNTDKFKVLGNIEDAVPIKKTINLINGEVKSEPMYDLGQIKAFFKPMLCYQKEQNSDIIIIAQNKRKYKLGRLIFKI